MHRVVRLYLAACLLLLMPALADAATLRLVVAGLGKQIYLPVLLAERLGFFVEQGLEVQLIDDASGVRAEDRLLAGAVHGVVGFYDHTILLQAKGKFVRSVVQFSRAPGEAVLSGVQGNGQTNPQSNPQSHTQANAPAGTPAEAHARLASPADFRGRTLGVTGLGSSTHLLMRYLGVSHDVPLAEMYFLAVDSPIEFTTALTSGRIAAGITTEPLATRLLRSDRARLLVDLRTPQATVAALGGPYPGASLYLAEVWINAHRDEVQKLVNALAKALRYIDAHDAATIADAVPQEYFLGHRPDYVAALAASKSMFIADGAMPAGGPEHVLELLRAASRTVKQKAIDLDRTYTNDFIRASRP